MKNSRGDRLLDLDFLILSIISIAIFILIFNPFKKTEEVQETSDIRPIIIAPVEYKTVYIREEKKLFFEEETEKILASNIILEIPIEEHEDEEMLDAAEYDTEFLVETTEIEPEETRNFKTTFDRYSDEVIVLAKCLEGEAGALKSTMEKAAVIWCILNRVDNEHPYYPDDIIGVVTQKWQFTGYDRNNRVREDLIDLVLDVLGRWEAEHHGEEDVGRILPKDYLWFYGLTARNTFRNAYEKDKAEYWDWSLPNPYED